jgi:WD40 repeat protein
VGQPEPVIRFAGHPQLNAVAVSPDGGIIATVGLDLQLRFWKPNAVQPLRTVPVADTVPTLIFHPRDPGLLLIDASGWVRWVHPETGQTVREWMAHPARAAGLDISSDGKLIVTGGRDNRVRFWTAQGEPLGEPLRFNHWVMHLDLSPDGQRLLVTCQDQNAYLWDVTTRRPMGVPMAHDRVSAFGSFCPAGRVVMTCGWDGYVRLWDAKTGVQEGPNLRHRFAVPGGGFSSDGRLLVTGAKDGTFRVWDFAGREDPERLFPLVMSPLGERLVISNAQAFAVANPLGAGNAEEGHPLRVERSWTPLAINDSGDRILLGRPAAGEAGYRLQLSDALASRLLGPEHLWRERPERCEFARGKAGQNVAMLWSNEVALVSGNGVELWRKTVPGGLVDLTLSSDGQWVAGGSGTQVFVWRSATGEAVLPALDHEQLVRRIIFDEAGGRILVCTSDETLNGAAARIWNVRTGKRGPDVWHTDGVSNGRWLPDGRRVITVSEDGTGRIWDAETGQAIGDQLSHRHQIEAVDLNERLILTGGHDRTVRLWDKETGLPFGPPFTYGREVLSGHWLTEGNGFIARLNGNNTWLQRLSPTRLSVPELMDYARLMGAETRPGVSPEHSARDLAEQWRALQARHPEQFQSSEADLLRWYRFEADLRRRAGLHEEAMVLYEKVLVRQPGDPLAQSRQQEMNARRRAASRSR